VTIYRGNELAAAQDAVVLFKRSVALLVLGSLLLVALALWVSPGRRRTTLELGVWLVVAVVVMTALLPAIRRQLLEMVPGGVFEGRCRVSGHGGLPDASGAGYAADVAGP
jgi:hypothetical protein